MLAETARMIAQRHDILERLRALLIEEIDVRREGFEIDPDAPLFGTGIALDSVDGIELAVGIETVFGVTLPEGDEVAAVTRSLNTIVDFVVATRAPQDAEAP